MRNKGPSDHRSYRRSWRKLDDLPQAATREARLFTTDPRDDSSFAVVPGPKH